MARPTIVLLFFLTIVATLLIGINLGKTLSLTQKITSPTPSVMASPSPTLTLMPSPSPFLCSLDGDPCGIGLTGKSIGMCCEGYVCKTSTNPDEGGSCIKDKTSKKLIPSPTPKKISNSGVSTYTDRTCGFTFSYPGGYLSSNTTNGKSSIFTDPNDETHSIVTACEDEIPKPPLTDNLIENIELDGVPTKLYHDTSSKDGTPRDEVIVMHPTNGKEIIIAGFGSSYNAALASFKFIR